MCPAEGRKKVIQRRLVGYVYGGKRETPFVTFAFEQVVVANGNIKQAARGDTRRIVVGVCWVRRWYLYKCGPKLRCQAGGWPRGSRGSMLRSAEEPRFELLIGSQRGSERIGHVDGWLPI